MPEKNNNTWKTCGYVRLSREDGDKEESNSVKGQRDLIREYLRGHPELCECGMKVDDGYTGSNFERPGFREMMADVKAGEINCIVVKDSCVIIGQIRKIQKRWGFLAWSLLF